MKDYKDLSDENFSQFVTDAVKAANEALNAQGVNVVVIGNPLEHDEKGAVVKVMIQLPKADGKYETHAERNFRMYGADYGLTPDMLGKKIQLPEEDEVNEYTIAGIGTSSKNPVQLEWSDGSKYNYPAELVLKAVNGQLTEEIKLAGERKVAKEKLKKEEAEKAAADALKAKNEAAANTSAAPAATADASKK